MGNLTCNNISKCCKQNNNMDLSKETNLLNRQIIISKHNSLNSKRAFCPHKGR